MRSALRRLLLLVPTVFGVITLVFLVLHVLPGDPAAVVLGGAPPTPQTIIRLRHYFGLDQPLSTQYWLYLRHLTTGNLGTSYVTGQPVAHMIGSNLPSTLELTASAILFSVVTGVGLGVAAGLRRGTWIDSTARVISQFGISVPTFWTGIVLLLLLSVRVHAFPTLGGDGVRGLVLPTITLGLVGTALLTRVIRSSVIETARRPFVLQLHAKHLPTWRINFVHILRNSLIAALTTLGVLIAEMLGGSVVVETVFSREGVGSMIINAIQSRDLPVVQGTVIVVAVLYVVLNLLIDFLYFLVDPRLRVRSVRTVDDTAELAAA
jgi:peptide/nickel transport system permease protein